MEGPPGIIYNKMIHPSQMHQNQTCGLSSFEVLTFIKHPLEKHLSNVRMLFQIFISALGFFPLMWKTTCINPDTQMQSANEQKERARSYSNPVGFSHDSGVNVAHLRVHRLTNLHLNICQYWIWISFAYFNMKVTVLLCFTDGHSAGSWNVQHDFTHKWNFVPAHK